jgi:hypothetical protein
VVPVIHLAEATLKTNTTSPVFGFCNNQNSFGFENSLSRMFFPPLLKTLLKNFVLQGVYNGSRAGNNVAGSQTFHAQMLPSERMHMQIALRQTFHANQVYFDGQP